MIETKQQNLENPHPNVPKDSSILHVQNILSWRNSFLGLYDTRDILNSFLDMKILGLQK